MAKEQVETDKNRGRDFTLCREGKASRLLNSGFSETQNCWISTNTTRLLPVGHLCSNWLAGKLPIPDRPPFRSQVPMQNNCGTGCNAWTDKVFKELASAGLEKHLKSLLRIWWHCSRQKVMWLKEYSATVRMRYIITWAIFLDIVCSSIHREIVLA